MLCSPIELQVPCLPAVGSSSRVLLLSVLNVGSERECDTRLDLETYLVCVPGKPPYPFITRLALSLAFEFLSLGDKNANIT